MKRKNWPNEISVNMLSQLTGKDRGTVTRRLEGLEPVQKKTKANYYDLKVALNRIFEPIEPEEDDFEGPLNAMLEKAKLDRARRKSVELDMELKRKNLIEKGELEGALQKVFGSIRSRLLNLPLKIAQSVSAKTSKKEIETESRKLVKEALKELSETNVYESL